jgi:hypothetical protein
MNIYIYIYILLIYEPLLATPQPDTIHSRLLLESGLK